MVKSALTETAALIRGAVHEALVSFFIIVFLLKQDTLIVPCICGERAIGILLKILLETSLGIGFLSAAEKALGCSVGK